MTTLKQRLVLCPGCYQVIRWWQKAIKISPNLGPTDKLLHDRCLMAWHEGRMWERYYGKARVSDGG